MVDPKVIKYVAAINPMEAVKMLGLPSFPSVYPNAVWLNLSRIIDSEDQIPAYLEEWGFRPHRLASGSDQFSRGVASYAGSKEIHVRIHI